MSEGEIARESKSYSWVWSVLPVNASLTGFNTMLPLYILLLGGTVIEVALLTTLYNVMLIPSSIFWGSVTDRLPRRRLFFTVSYSAIALLFFAMLLLPNIYWLAFLYAWLAFAVVANSAASNLLVMETTPKKAWVSSYSRLSLTGNLGAIVGLVVGLLWSSLLPLGEFLAFCSACATISLGFAFALIHEPDISFETIQLTFHPLGFFSRVSHSLTSTLQGITSRVFTQLSPKGIVKIIRAARVGVLPGRSLLFASTFVFMIGTSLLNTSYTPFLAVNGVLDDQVFAITLVNNVVQTAAYRWIGVFTTRLGEIRVGSYAVLFRVGLYVLTGVSALLFRGLNLFAVNTAILAFVGIGFALWNSSTSVLLFSSLGQGRQAGLLGGYSALSSLGLVFGSLFSGYISFYMGYAVTFALAAALVLISYFFLEGAFRGLGIVQRRASQQA